MLGTSIEQAPISYAGNASPKILSVDATLDVAFWRLPPTSDADRLALPLDVAALSSGPIEDVIGRLDQARRFKLPQEIASAGEIDAFVDDSAPALDVGVLKK